MNSNFLDFLSTLQNVEKTRNFNAFKNYNLDEFAKTFNRFELLFSNKLPIRISVVGTNGKGSTSHYLATILNQAKATVGLFTSPHFVSPKERISVLNNSNNFEAMDTFFDTKFAEHSNEVKNLSYFEFLTLFAYSYFQWQKTDFEIWEAGLGGRLDATKLVNPDYVVLTKIDFDHAEILGKTKEKICIEKLGMICKNTKCLFALDQQETKLNQLIESTAINSGISFSFFSETEIKEYTNYLELNFNFAKKIISEIANIKNLPLLNGSNLDFNSFPKPKGRMEVLIKNPLVIFDPAHNPDAVKFTLGELTKTQPKLSLVIGSLPDKDTKGILLSVSQFKLTQILVWEGAGFATYPKDVPPDLFLFSKEPGSLKNFITSQPNPVLICGSFRLYEIVANLLQNTIIMEN